MRKIFNYFVLMIVMVSLALIACGCSENAEGGETDSSKLYDNNGDGNMSTAIDSANGGDASTVDSGDTEDSSVGATPPSSGKEDPPAVQTDERDYEIMYNYELDKCYFVFYDPIPYEMHKEGMLSASLSFSSVEDFLFRILNGKLKSYEKSHITVILPKSDIGYEICDLKNIYFPVLPKGFEAGRFSWYGKRYTFAINAAEGEEIGSVAVYDEEALNDIYERNYVNASPPNGGTVVTEMIDGANIVGKYFYSSGGTLYKLQYELQTEEKRVFVEKRYNSKDGQPYATLYCFEGDKFYMVKLNGLASELDNDLLLSFSIEPYLQ